MDLEHALQLAVGLVFGSEGFRTQAYLDGLASPARWTIGHGTTFVAGHPVCGGMSCTRAQADAWAAADMRNLANEIRAAVEVALTEPQLAALISLAYNIGIGRFRACSLLAALNAGLYQAAAALFVQYDHAGGVALAGLRARRIRERDLFLSATAPAALAAHPVPSAKSPAALPVSPPGPTADDLNLQEINRLGIPSRALGGG